MTIRLPVYVRPTWQHHDLDRRTGWNGPRLIRRWVLLEVRRPEPGERGALIFDYGYGRQHWRPRLDRMAR
jgi:hypothetical protein